MSVQITAFYHFSNIPQPEIPSQDEALNRFAEENKIYGLIILGSEGINGTVSGSRESIDKLESWLSQSELYKGIEFKRSEAQEIPFRRFRVKIRDEIVSLGAPELRPQDFDASFFEHAYLEPHEWDLRLEDPEVTVIDTRNLYETKIGYFDKAICPPIDTFGEFTEYLKAADFPKDKPYLIYCTGGIRCEKAYIEMRRQGFKNVAQLKGGILKYFETTEAKHWNGECFVFDHRVAVDPSLQPSKIYHLCPHCGQTAHDNDKLSCQVCETEAYVCSDCQKLDPSKHTCSKNCAHHHGRGTKRSAKKSKPHNHGHLQESLIRE